jgi:hypothetical protein
MTTADLGAAAPFHLFVVMLYTGDQPLGMLRFYGADASGRVIATTSIDKYAE